VLANAYLHFYHYFDLERGWDGGVVEYSANGGAWTDAGSLIDSGKDYVGSIYSLGNRQGFTGVSHGYVSTRLNLSSLAGQSVKFRWRLGTDSSNARWGWWVDDVRIYTCESGPGPVSGGVYLPIIHVIPPGPLPGFNSQFNGSATGWVAHSGAWYIGSSYIWTNGLSGLWSSISYDAQFANFDYQVRLRRAGCSGCSNNLIVRGTPYPLVDYDAWYSWYIFQYSRDGTYSIWKAVGGGAATALQNWTSSSAINQDSAWNTLRVVANGSNLRFYINGTQVWSGLDSSLTSGRVGIGMYRSSTSTDDELDVDWAKLSVLGSGVNKPDVPDEVSPQQQALNDEANRHGGGSVNMAPERP
jgi:hypothetical protein